MSDAYQTDTRVVCGRKVRIEWQYDQHSGEPWKECDGSGPVSEWRPKDSKKPGERELLRDGASRRFYDWEAAIKQARKEGWGLGINGYTALMCELRRVPTAKQVRERAVKNNYEWLWDWCHDNWHWCGIVVIDIQSGVERSLWSIESTNEHGYHEEIITDLVEDMYVDVVRVLMGGEEEAA